MRESSISCIIFLMLMILFLLLLVCPSSQKAAISLAPEVKCRIIPLPKDSGVTSFVAFDQGIRLDLGREEMCQVSAGAGSLEVFELAADSQDSIHIKQKGSALSGSLGARAILLHVAPLSLSAYWQQRWHIDPKLAEERCRAIVKDSELLLRCADLALQRTFAGTAFPTNADEDRRGLILHCRQASSVAHLGVERVVDCLNEKTLTPWVFRLGCRLGNLPGIAYSIEMLLGRERGCSLSCQLGF